MMMTYMMITRISLILVGLFLFFIGIRDLLNFEEGKGARLAGLFVLLMGAALCVIGVDL